jgi:tRNA dimethylallyltransferase
LALETVQEIESRGKVALFVGGTGFYLRALRQPFFVSPETDLALRERLKALHGRHGAPHLHRMLQRVDRVAASRITPNDWSRTIRALEFYFQTGRPISEAQPDRPPPPDIAERILMIALNPPRGVLYERINARTDRMFQAGWVEEVKTLIASGVPDSAKAFNGHGYRRIVQFLREEMSLGRAIELTKLDTRHYAKRQLTWFKREPGVTWFSGFGDDPAIQTQVIEFVKNCSRLDQCTNRVENCVH